MPTRRMCCRLGCEAKYEGDQPANWRHLLMFWSARPISSFADIPDATWDRDGVLCPQHAAELEAVLTRKTSATRRRVKTPIRSRQREVFGLVRIARIMTCCSRCQHQPAAGPIHTVFDSANVLGCRLSASGAPFLARTRVDQRRLSSAAFSKEINPSS
jgi:hypothetical protein